IYLDDNQEWQAKSVGVVGNPEDIPLPVDISISADDSELFVNSFLDGKTRVFDVTDPFKPGQIYEKKMGHQVNMVSSSWDGKRKYYTTSLLSNWDKKGESRDAFFAAYDWDGKELKEQFRIDFIEKKLGQPHQMRF